ncbi:SoxR reducing system RseC family protein [Lentimicrobium sp.]|jgi:sigma-E factor negative regulatory protein RseC|uniref:SoxR reducing system RseC family protein n=1 Tax=Lentimicrobium sp. TaxID=2034841 RepID=UPI0025D48151|nr:SoxR reducing system RseC family protein [Lentimicrobium sp.]MCO5255512.1 SoxR reducing system RseC family protein [Lentimicrobium sp.]MCO5261790.1 SoxR reducing system RseC family protein [Lentimicrobium sp.]HOP14013.1 SoxR reducing system RseC family protein [Lentimicrobium sp.]HPF63970.1 SoxR reducing system RseC family protein [Lentimicrobium sp.]HPJ63711.1 SoxR reducing system RseC family protein [Lentimicrobium sp.]
MSSSTDCIAKTGVVQSIEGQKVFVKVISVSACASCHAKGACTASDTSERIIEAELEPGTSLKPGQIVSVQADVKAGNAALFYGYILPFLLVFAVLVIAALLTSEVVAGLVSLGVLLPYYAVLYLLRDRMGKRFKFSIQA